LPVTTNHNDNNVLALKLQICTLKTPLRKLSTSLPAKSRDYWLWDCKSCRGLMLFLPDMLPPYRGHFGIARSVRLSVPWRSCLGYKHAGCLQLSHRRPPEMCGLRTRPRTDVDPPRFLDPWTDADGLIGGETICHRRPAIGGGGAYRLAASWAIICSFYVTIFLHTTSQARRKQFDIGPANTFPQLSLPSPSLSTPLPPLRSRSP